MPETFVWKTSGHPINVTIISDELKEKKQIVQSEDSLNEEKKHAAFLSDKDRSFERQTRARKVDSFKKKSQEGGSSRGRKGDIKLSDLAAFASGTDPFRQAARDYTRKKKGKQDNGRQAQEDISSTNDHLEGVPLGDITNLNTAEYKFYGFYHRIRQQLEQFWGASIQEKTNDLAREGRYLSSSEDLITSLQITLDKHGRIVSIRLIGSSGIQELDAAAIEAFNEAGPFPNPPRELVKNGHVILEWGFVVKT